MNHTLQRPGKSGQHKTGFQQGKVEPLAIKGDHRLGLGKALLNGHQHRSFLMKIPHEVLLNMESLRAPASYSNQEGIGSCSPGKPRGFRVEEKNSTGINISVFPLKELNQ
jgi:hypothetical protein